MSACKLGTLSGRQRRALEDTQRCMWRLRPLAVLIAYSVLSLPLSRAAQERLFPLQSVGKKLQPERLLVQGGRLHLLLPLPNAACVRVHRVTPDTDY